jgi:acyl dehydratase
MRWDELQVGAAPAPRTLGPVTRTDFVRYQGASGDFNPIHHDETFAKASGFDAPLAVGMFQAGVMNSLATDWLGPENVRSTRIRWKAPVFPGDVLTVSCAVAARHEAEEERRVDLELQCVKADGVVVVQGWMTFVVP